jgi:hypothetical protein
MSFPLRLGIPILVTAATLIICTLGVRAELKMAKDSIAEHRLQAQHAQRAPASIAAARDEQALNLPPR